jgi:4-amino-4-deoxy-L-arabinose transferase-like glycosyltransferase
MENLNPFWYAVLLIFVWVAPICAGLTLIAGAVWLVRRSKASLVFTLLLLLCTVVAGIIFVIAIFREELR